MNAKHILLASLAAASCLTIQPTFATGADDTWLEYAQKHGLPLTATSNPPVPNDWLLMELSLSEGYADRATYVREILAKGDNANNFAGRNAYAKLDCEASNFMRELSRTDGSPQGDGGGCGPRGS